MVTMSLFAPIFIMLSPVEKFLSIQTLGGDKKGFLCATQSLIVALLISYPAKIVLDRWPNAVISNAGTIILLSTLLLIFTSRYTGLRITEVYRFRSIKRDLKTPK